MIKQFGSYLVCIVFFVCLPLRAQIPVRIESAAKLFAQPSERAMILTEINARSTFRALEQSSDRKWIFISDGLRYGWIRKVFVKPMDEASAAMTDMVTRPVSKEAAVAESAPPDSDLPDEDTLEDAPMEADAGDPEGDSLERSTEETSTTYLVKAPTSFYEAAKKNSPKYGKLDPNDQVELLSSSEDDKWARVRLIETGEEGWVPKMRIGRKVPRNELSRLESPSGKLTHIGLSGVVAPSPWGFGFLAFIRRGFSSLTIGDAPVELAFGGGMNMGTTEVHNNVDVSVNYIDLRLYTHWEPLLSPRLGLPIELGLLYKYASVTTEYTPAQFEALDTRIMESEIGAFIGVGLSYFILDSLRIEAIPQIQMTSSVDFVLNAGVVYSF